MSEIFCVTLPDIGEGVVEGEVIEWLKAEGDSVGQDEPVVVVMTDKATVELPAPHPGTVVKHYYEPGEMAALDQPLYDIALKAGVELPAGYAHEAPKIEAPKRPECPKRKQKKQPNPRSRTEGEKALATPPVRRLAKEMGVDIRTVEGSGPGGRVLREDLEHLLTSPVKQGSRRRAGPDVSPGQSTPLWELAGDQRTPLIGFRKYISEKMVEAKYLVPHFAYFDSCDCSRMITMRRRVKAEADAHGVKLTYMAFFIRALSLALKEQPVFNSSVDLDTNEHVIHQVHNIGIATKSKDGLIVPVLKNVQDMGFHDVIRAYDALRRKAVSDTLVSSDMKEATITISNFGTEGGKWATPIINYPEVCILGLAKIEKQPVVKGQQVVAQDRLNLSWCGDHRVLDGDKMAKFSNTFIRLIENPALLL